MSRVRTVFQDAKAQNILGISSPLGSWVRGKEGSHQPLGMSKGESLVVDPNLPGFGSVDLRYSGGLKYFSFSTLFGEMFNFDSYFSSGLEPLTNLLG